MKLSKTLSPSDSVTPSRRAGRAIAIVLAAAVLAGCHRGERAAGDASSTSMPDATATLVAVASDAATATASAADDATPVAAVTAASPTVTASTASTAGTAGFTDISGVDGEAEIRRLTLFGVFGEATGAFHPNDTIARGLFVRWLVLANNSFVVKYDGPETRLRLALASATPSFVDVPATDPDFPYVQGMADAGYVIGTDATHFTPARPLTREELVAIVVARNLQGKAVPAHTADENYVDYEDRASISKPYVESFYADLDMRDSSSRNTAGRVFGSSRFLRPQKPVMRAEAAIALSNLNGFNEMDAPAPDPTPSPEEAIAVRAAERAHECCECSSTSCGSV